MLVDKLLDKVVVSDQAVLVGVVNDGRNPRIVSRFGQLTTKGTTKQLLTSLQPSPQSSSLSEALQLINSSLLSVANGARQGVPKTVLVFVDRNSIQNSNALARLSHMFKKNNIKLVIISEDRNIDQDFVKLLAYDKDSVFFPSSLRELRLNIDPVVSALHPGTHCCSLPFVALLFVHLCNILDASAAACTPFIHILFLLNIVCSSKLRLEISRKQIYLMTFVVKYYLKAVCSVADPCWNKTCPLYASCRSSIDRRPKCFCPLCSELYAPICGSDWHTYASECHMMATACQSNRNIIVAKRRSCGMLYFCIFVEDECILNCQTKAFHVMSNYHSFHISYY